ncbi:MAG TPA: hypothetical protein VHP83_08255 [Aggregatilineaceae bacterium]|nr:hypothetical protein [Aggregatilineaceae bacterium]
MMKLHKLYRLFLAVMLLAAGGAITRPVGAQEACPGFAESRLIEGGLATPVAGQQAEVYFTDLPAPIDAEPEILPAGSVIEVLSGPECVNNAAWWIVAVNGQNGWAPEGLKKTYWLEPLPELSQTYVAADNSVQFGYPADWAVILEQDGAVLVGAAGSNGVAAGNPMVAIYLDSHSVPSLVNSDGTPEELLTIDAQAGASQGVDYGDPILVQFGTRQAAYTYAFSDQLGVDTLVMVVDLGNGKAAMLIGMTAIGEVETVLGMSLAIGYTLMDPAMAATSDASTSTDAGTDTSTSGGLDLGAVADVLNGQSESTSGSTEAEPGDTNTAQYVSADGAFSFDYPAGWVAEPLEGNVVIVVNDTAIYNLPDLDSLAPGQVLVVLYPSVSDAQDVPQDMVGGEGTTAGTIVSYYASMGMATGYMQEGAMEFFDMNGYEASSSYAHAAGHDRLVMVVDNGQGDYFILIAYTAPGEMEAFRADLTALLASSALQ